MSNESPVKIFLTTVSSYLERIRDAVRRHRRAYQVPYHQDPGSELVPVKNPEEPQADLSTVVDCAVQVDLPKKTCNTFYERMASKKIRWKRKLFITADFFIYVLALTFFFCLYLMFTKTEPRHPQPRVVSRTAQYAYDAMMTLTIINAVTTGFLFIVRIVDCIIWRMEQFREEYMKTCNTFYERMASKMIKWERKLSVATVFFYCALALTAGLSAYLSDARWEPTPFPPRFVSRTAEYACEALMTLYIINGVISSVLCTVCCIIRHMEMSRGEYVK